MARHRGCARTRLHAESCWLRISRRVALIVLVGSLTAFAVMLSSPRTEPVRLVRDLILFHLATRATVWLCWWPRAEVARARRAWRLLAIALLLSTAANACFTLIPDAAL